nr:Ig-like domain-containing protein [Lachnospiraceae bacterium]
QKEVIESGEFEQPADEQAITVSKVKFKNNKLTLQMNGDFVYNPAEATMAGGAEAPPVHYVTDNKDIVAVDNAGNFYPMGQGKTTVTAYCGKKKTTCNVTVVSYTNDISIINEKNEDVTGKTLELHGGQKAFLTVSFDPYDSTDSRKVTWKSSHKKAVSVKDGILTVSEVKAETTVTITATVNSKSSDSGKISRTVTIRVIPAVPDKNSSADKTHKLSLKVAKKSGSKMSLVTTEGKNSKELTINIKGENDISEGEFLIEECISTNPDVVEVAMPGALAIEGKNAKTTATVTAKSPGVAYIVVKSRSAENAAGDRNVKRCKVTVTSPATAIRAESGTLKIEQIGTRKTITMRRGTNGTVKVALDPAYSTDAGKIKVKASGGISYKNGIITAGKLKPAKLVVQCGKLKETVYVTVTK